MKVGQSDPLSADLDAFIQVMSAISPGAPIEAVPTVAPDVADDAIRRSELISRVQKAWPWIVDGPIDLGSQQWVATQPPSYRPSRLAVLSEHAFVDIEVAEEGLGSTKPFGVGLHTSTAAARQPGMWLRYLELHRGSTLFALPWTVWQLRIRPAARVFEVRSARDWATLISRYPLEQTGATYPHWKTIATDWDGVHVTLSAVAAIQGVRPKLAGLEPAAPSYWDVESTLWLRWMIESSEHIGR